jgi:hypothetical protein
MATNYQTIKECQPQTSSTNTPAKLHLPIVIKLEEDVSSTEMTLPSVLPDIQIQETSINTPLKQKMPRYTPAVKRTVIKKRFVF